MKTIIAGSRGITDYNILLKAIDESKFEITEIVSGGARGADALGEWYASQHNLLIHKFLAEWNKHGKKAGILRNIEMSDNADALIALWDGKSRGTKHMIDQARKKGLSLYVHTI